ncbi:MAG: sodium:calcium antiporter [Candidatus Micrarchaeia archaeon]|jgi:cation:H+ antiporter
MIIINLLLFLVFLFILIKCAGYAIRYSSILAKILRFPEFIVSFFIVALISVIPEATIAIIAAFNGQPELGLGTLLGAKVADLTLVLGIVALFSLKSVKVKSKILKNNIFFLILLLCPIILGINGIFSRWEGIILILLGISFFVKIYKDNNISRKKFKKVETEPFAKSLFLLILSLGFILLSAFLTIKFAVNFANDAKLPAVLVGLTIIALGTCLPELIFSIKAVKKDHDNLALGDIIGTVVADATIILGLVAIISPFNFNPYNIYITGTAMFLAGLIVTIFMRSEKSINKKEGILLILFYIIFILTEFLVNNIIGFR